MQYFKKFWSDIITKNLATQTNIYSFWKSGKCIDRNAQKIERFMENQMLMKIVSLLSYDLYWSKDLRVDCVANVVSMKRYELIRRYVHQNDNTEKKDDSSGLFKAESVAHILCTNCLSVDQEQYQSTYKQMVPAKTKRSGIRQYLQKKKHKWRFKNFLPAGASGIIYSLLLYARQKPVWQRKVVRLK